MKSLSEVTYSDMNIIAEYMDDCLREYIEFHFFPCTTEKFLREYIKREPSFNDVLKKESFGGGVEMKVREIRYLCVPSLVIEIYPIGWYGRGKVYFRGLVKDIPEILLEEEVLSILPLDSYMKGTFLGISIEYDENIMKECKSSKKEDEQ